MPRKSYKIQEALQQRKQSEAAALDNLRVEETAYQCYFQPDSLPSPMESGVICILPLAKLSVYPNHETYFPLYTGERLDDMVESKSCGYLHDAMPLDRFRIGRIYPGRCDYGKP